MAVRDLTDLAHCDNCIAGEFSFVPVSFSLLQVIRTRCGVVDDKRTEKGHVSSSLHILHHHLVNSGCICRR